MSKEEARKLIGGYATGSLSEAEKSALFEAALEDQELFDELSDEQVLKEVLDEPGARQRLLAALEPPRHRAWIWGWAGAAATLAIVIAVVVFQKHPAEPQQVAQVLKVEQPAAAPVPVTPPAPKAAAAPTQRKVAPPAEAPPVQAPARADVRTEVDQVKPQAFGAVSAGPAIASRSRENAAASAPSGFSFSYAVGADGALQITPAVPGFLSVSANDVVLFPSSAVPASISVMVAIPPRAASLVIGFSRAAGTTGSPIRRDGPAGTVTDQDPPNGRIAIQLFLKPATQ